MLKGQKKDRDGQHRRAEHHDDAGGVHGPQEERHAEPGHAGGAHFVNRHDEIQSGENRGKSGDEDADGNGGNLRIGVRAAIRSVERPAGIDAAGDRGIQREQPTDDVDIPAQQIQSRKGQVARADHQRHEEISEHRRNRWNQEKENHDDAMHREQLVVGFRLHQGALRLNQVNAHQHGKRAADDEEKSDRNQVQQSDALVVQRKEPGLPAIVRVQIIFLSAHAWFQRGRTHCFPLPLASPAPCPAREDTRAHCSAALR